MAVINIDDIHLFLERAAIIEYDGKIPRKQAEIYAAREFGFERDAWLDAISMDDLREKRKIPLECIYCEIDCVPAAKCCPLCGEKLHPRSQ